MAKRPRAKRAARLSECKARIAALIARTGQSPTELAARLNVCEATFLRWKSGKAIPNGLGWDAIKRLENELNRNLTPGERDSRNTVTQKGR